MDRSLHKAFYVELLNGNGWVGVMVSWVFGRGPMGDPHLTPTD